MLRCYRVPYSTNVERVSLALAHKGIGVEWVDVDPADRTEVDRVSGQSLVPVLVDGDRVVTDSTEILRYLEEVKPEPRLFPASPARRAEVEVFLDWFNKVWKGPPNEIEALRGKPHPNEERIDALGRDVTAALDRFERLLDGRDYLYGEFSAADCAAFPFLKYALDDNADDDESFHAILREFQRLGENHPRLAAWIARVDERPRA